MMDDTRVRVAYDKPIDLAQLDAELGGHGLTASDLEVVAVEGSPVTAEQLADAIAAHVPEVVPDPAEEMRAAIAAATDLPSLKAALLGQARAAVVPAANDDRAKGPKR